MNIIDYLNKTCPLYIKNGSKREIRHDFFKTISTELHAYLLGLIMSDGSINDKRATLSHSMNIQDRELIRFYKVICPNAYVLEFIPDKQLGPRGNIILGKQSIKVAIASITMINDLHDLGIILNKTYKELKIPRKIPVNFIKHFLRGYFDGDGSFSGSVVKDKGRKNYRIRMQFQIDSKTNKILLEFKSYLLQMGISCNIYESKRDNMFRLATHSIKECKKLYNLLYNDSHYYLNRKFNKFKYYVNTEVSQIIADHRNALEVNVNESNNPPKSAEHLNSLLKDENVR